METHSFTITKRDGTQERFSLDKIMNAIIKAFNSQKEPIDLSTWANCRRFCPSSISTTALPSRKSRTRWRWR